MSVSTLLFIIRSLWPFVKEIVLRDKGFKEFLLSNKTATTLAVCLIIVFGALYYTSIVADTAFVRLRDLEERNRLLSSQLEASVGTKVISNEGCKEIRPICRQEQQPPPEPPRKEPLSPPPRVPIKAYAEMKLKEFM